MKELPIKVTLQSIYSGDTVDVYLNVDKNTGLPFIEDEYWREPQGTPSLDDIEEEKPGDL